MNPQYTQRPNCYQVVPGTYYVVKTVRKGQKTKKTIAM